jgi:hypothetical protein
VDDCVPLSPTDDEGRVLAAGSFKAARRSFTPAVALCGLRDSGDRGRCGSCSSFWWASRVISYSARLNPRRQAGSARCSGGALVAMRVLALSTDAVAAVNSGFGASTSSALLVAERACSPIAFSAVPLPVGQHAYCLYRRGDDVLGDLRQTVRDMR